MFNAVTNGVLQDWAMYGSGFPFLAKNAWSRDQDRSCPVSSQKHRSQGRLLPNSVPHRLPATCLLLLLLLLRCLSLVSSSFKLITAGIHRSSRAHYPSPVILLILFYLYSCLSFLISRIPLSLSSLSLSACEQLQDALFRSVEH